MPLAFLIALAALVGLVIGSFLNVVIYRSPRGESVISPPSRCPECHQPIKPQHNIPVVSWLALRGRCASCRAPIPVRYPLVELITGVLFVGVAVHLVDLGLLWALPAYGYFAAIAVALTVIDIELRRLPNNIVLPSYPVVAALLAVASAGSGDWWALARAGIGGLALFGFYLLLAVLYPAGMGFGDVKLAGIIGAILGYLSWQTLILGAFAAFLFGAVVGVAVIASGRGNRKTALPFGPFMLLGTMGAFFLGNAVATLYWRAMGIA